jgi:hypothetical protein
VLAFSLVDDSDTVCGKLEKNGNFLSSQFKMGSLQMIQDCIMKEFRKAKFH